MSPVTLSHRLWSLFFLAMTVAIVVTLMVPALFGLQNVTQWGAMYTDAYCSAFLYAENPHGNPRAAFETALAGRVNAVWSIPMFNEEMCLMWSRKFCGTVTQSGMPVRFVSPYYKGRQYVAPKNPCDLALSLPYDSWFRYAP